MRNVTFERVQAGTNIFGAEYHVSSYAIGEKEREREREIL